MSTTYFRKIDNIAALIFLIGLGSRIFIELIGQLYISEIILVSLFPFLFFNKGKVLSRSPNTSTILILGGVWLVGQIFTDIFRQTTMQDLARGWAGIVVMLMSFGSLYILINNNLRRLIIFAWGYAFSGILFTIFQPSSYAIKFPWQFGYGSPIILMLFLLAVHFGKNNLKTTSLWVLPILGAGVLSFFLNARSLGGLVILATMIIWMRANPLTGTLLARLKLQNLFFAGLLMTISGLAVLEGYAYAAEQGILGERAREKYLSQQNQSLLGIIIGGRTEILASSQAIIDSPIIGHGSWAKNPYYRAYLYQLIDFGYQTDINYLNYLVNQTDLIPAHSHLTQNWIWAGVLGAIFWLWVLLWMGKVFIKANTAPNQLYPLIIYFIVIATWDILFSPFGAFMRITWAFHFIVFLFATRRM
jgi:hypothetical protein